MTDADVKTANNYIQLLNPALLLPYLSLPKNANNFFEENSTLFDCFRELFCSRDLDKVVTNCNEGGEFRNEFLLDPEFQLFDNQFDSTCRDDKHPSSISGNLF
jgi:hypothetical protein